MAGFDFFSQPQGPTIPINLFSENSAAGVASGNASPTTLSAAIRGGIKGFQQGQQFTANFQQEQIRQNKIDQQPVSNAQAAADLKAQQQINELNALKLDIANQTQDLKRTDTILSLQNKKQELTQQSQVLDDKQTISGILASGDPGQMRSILSNPRLLNTILSDTKFADATAGRLSSVMSPEESEQLFAQVYFKKSQELAALRERANTEARAKLFETSGKDVGKIQEGKIGWLFNSKGADFTTGLEKTTTAPSAQGLAAGWDVFYDDKRTTLNISDAENSAFSRTKEAYTSAGLVKKSAPQETATGTPAPQEKPFSNAFNDTKQTEDTSAVTNPGPPPTGAPAPEADKLQVQSNSPIVQQRARQLQQQAQSDPDLMNRLVAKGIIKAAPKQDAQVAATPTATPAPQANAGYQNPGAVRDEAVTPTQQVPAEVTKQNIADRVSVLPNEVKNKVEHPVVFKVLADPLTRSLPPLFKAVIAVESGGDRAAKNKDKNSTATGLFQMTAAAAKDTGTDSSIPAENVKGGVKYLNSMLEQFGDNEIPALMAYNGGAGLIRSAIESAGSADYEDIVYALRRFKDQGRFKGPLKNIDHIIKYPLKVLAYKEAFQAFSDA